MKTKHDHKWAIIANALMLLVLFTLPIYVKFGNFLEPEHWQRSENVVRMFEDCFTRDQPLNSTFSNVAAVLWTVSLSVCGFSWLLLKRVTPFRQSLFLLCSLALIGIWLFDELFHLTVALQIWLHVPKLLVYAIYGIATLIYLTRFRNEIRKTPYVFLLLGLLLFVSSNMTDILPVTGSTMPIYVEDSFKLLGLINVSYYYILSCHKIATVWLEKMSFSTL